MGGFRADHRGRARHSGDLGHLQRRRVQADQALSALVLHEDGLIEFPNPDYVAYARACGADGYSVDRIEDFEDAFRAAIASGRPTLIDAHITRLALPALQPQPGRRTRRRSSNGYPPASGADG